ncbi:hypothetical protein EST38_g13846 [Candolleomyces aberdarensis]|uniref:Homeobox domain-containing protein n=1 Tax=Candolleomyces aberdarensis TaxID=2316362 RepID=A0A4Q2CZS0_9AGAR|nr:hypothetical protein EST38_g13846 [Candolleomyces aberdarensis]
MQLQARSDSLSEQLHLDLQDTMSQASSLDCNAAEPRVTAHPPYLEQASRWLYDNLHNPYPSAETRRRLARESFSPEKDISAWFVEARKRIGWNNLRKQEFSNKRSEIVDAATRFFKNDYKNPVPDRIESALVEIQMKAQRLHHDKFEESRLATTLDGMVKDMTADLKQQSLGRKSRNPSRTKVRPSLAYPSPESSPSRSPEPESPASIILYNDWPSDTPKRDRSCTPYDDFRDPSAERSLKRQRTMNGHFGLPSPAPSLLEEDLSSPSPESQSSLLDDASCSNFRRTSTKRKRQSLDSDDHSPSKRLNKAPTPTPDLLLSQVGNVPVPLPASILGSLAKDEWINASVLDTEIPGPVMLDSLNPSEPLELELFDFSTSYPLMQLGEPFGESQLQLSNIGQDTSFSWLDQNISSLFDFAGTDFQLEQTSSVSDGQPRVSLDPELWAPPQVSEGVASGMTDPSPIISTAAAPHLSQSDRAEKTKLLLDLEAQWLALRAELASAS